MLVRVVLEVVLDLDGFAFMRHLHQSLKFWPLEHLGSDLFAVERVIDPLLHVSLLLLWSHLGQLSGKRLELIISHVFKIHVCG